MSERILHDQGQEFENDLFKQNKKLCGIRKLCTTPYHPQTNDQVERMKQTILSMLRTLPNVQKSKWKDYIKKPVHAYNCIQTTAIGYFPYYILFGGLPKH